MKKTWATRIVVIPIILAVTAVITIIVINIQPESPTQEEVAQEKAERILSRVQALEKRTQSEAVKHARSQGTRKFHFAGIVSEDPYVATKAMTERAANVPGLPMESGENRIKSVEDSPFSTFSIDTDTSSYSYVRRALNRNSLPEAEYVRTEEMINYFDYKYALPADKSTPFKPTVTVTDSPWRSGNKLIHIGIKGYAVNNNNQPNSNLVLLIDVSGSMSNEDRLPLVKRSIPMLFDSLKPTDTISIVSYASGTHVVLKPTSIKDRFSIIEAIEGLQAGGSTAGEDAINVAYRLAQSSYREDAVNRIILATDGDFNIGASDPQSLKSLVERQREKGVYLSVLGFGLSNYRDSIMQALAQNGNGVATYIDTLSESHKVLSREATSTLFPIAKDVKLQVEFNPATVKEYRLIGYENRSLNREDFKNDNVDAGEIHSDHTVTAIYEITPVGSDSGMLEPVNYPANSKPHSIHKSLEEYGVLNIRYKHLDDDHSKLISTALPIKNAASGASKDDVNFSIAVAGFAQLLKKSSVIHKWGYDDALMLADNNKGEDPYGYRSELVQMIRKAQIIESAEQGAHYEK